MSEPAWRDLGVRAASALVLLPLGVAAIWVGGWLWVGCVSAIVTGLWVEWAALWRARSPKNPALALLVSGMAYIAIAYAALLILRAGPAGRGNVLFVMVVVWAGDIGAYLAGRLFGGPRLAPRISPGKTWSGAAGGTMCAVTVGIAFGHGAPAAGLAIGLSVVAQAGDLLESWVKRRVGAKDSGHIIPGHGGLLDRLDGVLAAAPAACAWSLLSGPGPLWGSS